MRRVVREALTSSARFERLRERFRAGHIPLSARLVADGYQSGAFAPGLHPMVAMLSMVGLAVVPQLIRRVLDAILPFPDAPSGQELSKLLVGVLFAGTGPGQAASEKEQPWLRGGAWRDFAGLHGPSFFDSRFQR